MKKLILTLRLVDTMTFINAIKALRMATGWGLKESKDIIDALRQAPNNSLRVVMFAEHYGCLVGYANRHCGHPLDWLDAEPYEIPLHLDLTACGLRGPSLVGGLQ
jgi:hypothetical protein